MVLAEAKETEFKLAAALAKSEANNAKIKKFLDAQHNPHRTKWANSRTKPVEKEAIAVDSDEENEAYVASLLQSDEESPDVEMTDTEE